MNVFGDSIHDYSYLVMSLTGAYPKKSTLTVPPSDAAGGGCPPRVHPPKYPHPSRGPGKNPRKVWYISQKYTHLPYFEWLFTKYWVPTHNSTCFCIISATGTGTHLKIGSKFIKFCYTCKIILFSKLACCIMSRHFYLIKHICQAARSKTRKSIS